MKPRNLLVIMSDEHNPKVLGCAGHPVIHTPNLDALGLSTAETVKFLAREKATYAKIAKARNIKADD